MYFYPSADQQKTCEGCGDQGLNGDLVISYDVNRDSSLGEIMVERDTDMVQNCVSAHKFNIMY